MGDMRINELFKRKPKEVLEENIEYAKLYPIKTIYLIVKNILITLILIVMIMYVITRPYECEYKESIYKIEGLTEALKIEQQEIAYTMQYGGGERNQTTCTYKLENMLEKTGYKRNKVTNWKIKED